MGNQEKWFNTRAKKAAENLESIPADKRGPAARLLVSNPRVQSEVNPHEKMRGIEGGSSERSAVSQLPLLGDAPSG